MRLYIILATLLCMMSGCRSIEYIPVETTKTDSIYFHKLVLDSIYVHDSIFVKEKGDTIFQYKYKYIYKDKVLHDTAYIERIDTIAIPYPVEKPLTKWETFKMKTGGYALAIGCFILLLIVGKYVIKIKK